PPAPLPFPYTTLFRSQLDVVPADAVAFQAAAKAARLKFSKPKTVFLVDGDDRVGAFAQLLSRLGAAGINVTAATGVRSGIGRYRSEEHTSELQSRFDL